LAQKLLPITVTVGFLMFHLAMGGFRLEHLSVALLTLTFYGGPRTHSLYQFFLPFTLYIVLYDSQGYYADLIRGEVRVREPYQFDKTFFGIETAEGRLIPSQWLQSHTHQVLDIITSLAYLLFIPIFLIVALFFRFQLEKIANNRLSPEFIQKKTHALMWGMFWLNILCCSTYYWYPAAPPWYVDAYGFGPAQLDIVPSAAGALRFDDMFGVNLFKEFYAKCPNAFGAIPSGHVAFPMLCAYFAFKLKSLRVFCGLFFLLIAFAAVYLNHHYILDVLWGAAYGLLVGWAMNAYYSSSSATRLS
jgi:membrane-associated phospholipid phosphatase